jgi:CBS domain-containing protein
MMNEKISTIMIPEVITVGPEDTLDKVKQLLVDEKIEHIPVVDGTKLVGIVSYHDLWELNKDFKEYPKIKAKEIMTRKVAFLEPDSKIGTAAEIFLQNLFHCIPICDSEKNLVGIITNLDLIWYAYKKEYPKHYDQFEYFH